MDRRQRTLLFLYGNANIAGSALGIFGLLLFLVLSVILGGSPLLLLIVPALYAIGWLGASLLEKPAGDLRLRHQLTAAEIQNELDGLVRSLRGRVPQEVVDRVLSIKGSIVSILPQILDLTSADYDIYTIRKTALDYLPETLANYLKLPPAYRNLHPVKDGKTPKQLLIEQLDLLDQKMKEIVQNFAQNDTQQLMAQGRFLESRFGKPDLSPDAWARLDAQGGTANEGARRL
jgi:hypothetical protein